MNLTVKNSRNARRLLLIQLLVMCFTATAAGQLKDHSQRGEEYAILKDIKIAAVKIEFKGTIDVPYVGKNFECSIFAIKTREAVNFIDHGSGSTNVIKDLDIYYEMLVGRDPDYSIHDRMIENIFTVLSDPANREKADMGFVSGKRSYLLFDGKAKTPDLVWFDQRFVDVSLRRFSERRRDRVQDTETFWKDKIRFFSDDTAMPIKAMNEETRNLFLTQYKTGKFKTN